MVQGDRVQPTDWLDPDQNGASMLRFRLWKELLVASKTRRVLQKFAGNSCPPSRPSARKQRYENTTEALEVRTPERVSERDNPGRDQGG